MNLKKRKSMFRQALECVKLAKAVFCLRGHDKIAGQLMKVLKKAKVATGRGLKFRNMMDAAVESSLLGEVKKSKKTERVDIMDFLSVGEKPIEYFGDGGPGPMERLVNAPTHSAESFEND